MNLLKMTIDERDGREGRLLFWAELTVKGSDYAKAGFSTAATVAFGKRLYKKQNFRLTFIPKLHTKPVVSQVINISDGFTRAL